MSLLAEGIWPATAISASYGEDDRRMLVVRISLRIDEGPSVGRHVTYEERIDARSSLYAARSCSAVGWGGKSLKTLASDVEAWIAKTGGKTTVEVKHLEIKNGKRAGQIWDKVNSIGRGPKPLKDASSDTLSDADEYMRKALADSSPDAVGTPPEDLPPSSDDVPFVFCIVREPSPIARVLR